MKRTALALTLILALLVPVLADIVHFGTVQASTESASITKPSVPEFTVKFVNASYSVTTTNPYTGLGETKLISNNSIEVMIKNQPFDYSNNQIYYNIRVKPHFSGNWTEVYPLQNLTSSYNGDGTFSYAEYISPDSPTQSNSDYTIITFPVIATDVYSESGYYSGYNIQRYYSGQEGQEGRYSEFLSAIPAGGQLDFQVEAVVGHDSQSWYIQHPLFPGYGGYYEPAIAYDTTSDWSNTQIITIPGTSTSASLSPSPSPEPQKSESFPTTLVITASGISLAVVGVGLLFYFKKRNNRKV
jgi:hypothetical protein